MLERSQVLLCRANEAWKCYLPYKESPDKPRSCFMKGSTFFTIALLVLSIVFYKHQPLLSIICFLMFLGIMFGSGKMG